jgi:nucleoside-diphosphate-sugar epimerase
MTVLVTGAGLIGSSFAQWAAKRGERVVFLDPEPRADFLRVKLGAAADVALVRADVRDLPALIAAMREHEPNAVVHTAGLIGSRVDAMLYTALHINLLGTINVAEAVRLTGVRRLVHISTFGVYDSRREMAAPIGESFPRGPGRGYGNSKVAKELILEAYQRKYGFELIMLRPANVFGLGHFWSGSGGGEKMQALMEAGLTGKPARVAEAETMANEYVYAKDMGRAVDLAVTAKAPRGLMFNIGNGVVTQFDDLMAIVRRLFPTVQIQIEPGEPPKSKSQPLDISAAKRELGWAPQYSLEAALQDYAADLKAFGPGARNRLRA